MLGIKAADGLIGQFLGQKCGVADFTLVQANCLLSQAKTCNRRMDWTKGHRVRGHSFNERGDDSASSKLRALAAAVLGSAFPHPVGR
jgi:hypothetical protein